MNGKSVSEDSNSHRDHYVQLELLVSRRVAPTVSETDNAIAAVVADRSVAIVQVFIYRIYSPSRPDPLIDTTASGSYTALITFVDDKVEVCSGSYIK